MSEHGKRGPKGGFIDIDDPYERVPTSSDLHHEIAWALDLTAKAGELRAQGYEGNAIIVIGNAAAKLTAAIERALVPAAQGVDDDLDLGGPTVGYCGVCGEARDEFYTCRKGGSTVPKGSNADV